MLRKEDLRERAGDPAGVLFSERGRPKFLRGWDEVSIFLMVDAFSSVVFGWPQKVFLLEVASTEIAGGSIVMRAAYRLDVVVLGKMIGFVDGFVCIDLIDTENLPSHQSSQPYIYL
jgi:hypothetical protein